MNKISWSDVSQKGLTDTYIRFSEFNKQLESLDYKNLNQDQKINYDILQLIFEDQLVRFENKAHYLPLSSEGGFIISMLYATRSLILNDVDSKENYLKKLRTTPVFIESQIKWLEQGLNQDMILPDIVIENCIQLLDDLMIKDSKHFFLFEPLDGLVDQTVQNDVISSFESLRRFLRIKILTKCPEGCRSFKYKSW